MARIGVDLDGVIYPFEDAIKRYLRDEYGVPESEMPYPTSWHFYTEWGLSANWFDRLCNEAADAHELFAVLPPYGPAGDPLRSLRDAGHTIHIVTARAYGKPGVAEDATVKWLDRWRIPYDTLTFARDKTVIPTDWFIDDKPSNYEALDRTETTAVIMDRPWNRELTDALRVKNMRQFAELVLKDQQ
ncbi:hypothetical protein GS982_01595 [Rhodococcus hoagii]|uniref:5' nucleotidase, deoxy (Pyrimidine), cytosolic type C protein (NT5C) n=1 Tax=Rhodococcus hoagii TaxID=43767 RepID=A0A9Q4ZIP2_RHOHA|nr:hypothetical protein [Prescottella equi]NKT77291.1 hypothetical protein [Prescottella equi]NKZ81078.1 hypothetical protein [Prescottella equi]